MAWDSADSYQADAGLLTSFTTGNQAQQLARLDDRTRTSRVQAQLEQVYPGGAGRRSGPSATVAWPDEPYTGGGYAVYRPGQMAAYWPGVAGPHRADLVRGRAHRDVGRLHGERRAQRAPGGPCHRGPTR